MTLAACTSSPSTSSGTSSTAATTTPVGTNTEWVKDSTNALNVFLPDEDSIYWFDAYGTADGARTVISGQVPTARYWSFTAYPVPQNSQRQHLHDTQIAQSNGRYTLTIAQHCDGVSGTCMTMGATDGGILVMRLYVPTDINGAGTGGVPLPTIGYLNKSGQPITLDQATGNPAIAQVITGYRNQNGALPSALTQTYPPPAPVPVPVTSPTPVGGITYGTGPYANPDNIYEHIAYTTTRGNLVVTAKAPTYQTDSNPKANDLARSADQHPQVRYWSLCTTLKGRHTGDCLRDEQVAIPEGSDIVHRHRVTDLPRRRLRQLPAGRARAAPEFARLSQPPAEPHFQADRVHRAVPHDRHLRGPQQLTFGSAPSENLAPSAGLEPATR